MKIDINSDIGEGFGNYRVGDDEAILDSITSANIACGYHAGDHNIMWRTVEKAKARGVGIGAHPGMPDLMGFGRRAIQLSLDEMRNILIYQLGALTAFAKSMNYPVSHVSYHAAFGNMAEKNRDVADVLTKAIASVDKDLIIFSMPNNEVERSARDAGLRHVQFFLADRAYQANGALVPRGREGAVINDVTKVKARVKQLLETSRVMAEDGTWIDMPAQSILVHSDTPGAAVVARAVREAVIEAGATPAQAREIV